jgi:hypothetical protein
MTIQIADSRDLYLAWPVTKGTPVRCGRSCKDVLCRYRGSRCWCFASLDSPPLAIAHAQFKDCQASQGELTLSRNAQNWQFLDAVRPHSALLGREDGNFEACIYPLKLLRDFHLTFHLGGHVIPGETLPRTITVRPESTSIRYVYDSFCVCETWFAALHDTGPS